MGDQIGEIVEGSLYYVPLNEIKRLRNSISDPQKRASIIADICRLNTLYMIARAGSGHIGSSFSSMEIFSWLLTEELIITGPEFKSGDIFFSSKGHDAPGYYSVQMAMGRLPFDLIHKLRRIDGLPGHPDINTRGIVTNTGSLGMGISKAKGIAIANRLLKKSKQIYVLTGDGELQEGQLWESLISAVNYKLHEITVIVDHNKLQSDTFVKNVSDLGDLETKFKAFGWSVSRCDGNDISQLSQTISSIKHEKRPKLIIADTVKGKGVSFMEHTSLDSDVSMYRFHSGAPDVSSYIQGVQEIISRIDENINALKISKLTYEQVYQQNNSISMLQPQRLINAYSRALLDQAKLNENIVALDADLILDTGLIPFREAYPERFVECGIAEQDMVSMAGGMALQGIIPIVHSFSCFLSSRPNEQIYNNATEYTKIIYVGSLAGVIPGGPGHSHQAVRDISALSGVPNLTVLEPCCEKEVELLLDWCINKNQLSSYLRLISLPCDLPYELPSDYLPSYGQGVELFSGTDIVIFGYGPVILKEAYLAAQKLFDTKSKRIKVVNLPWLNFIDLCWFKDAVRGCHTIVSLDNHYTIGGQIDRIARAISDAHIENVRLKYFSVDTVPPSGTNIEVMRSVGLSCDQIYSILNE